MDFSTLELRLRQVAQILNEQQPRAAATHSSSPAPSQQPSSSQQQQPGVLPAGMVPAPGGAQQQGVGHIPGAPLPFAPAHAQPPLRSASLQHMRPSTPFQPSGMIPVSSGLPVEGAKGLLGSTATPAPALSSSSNTAYPALTTSGAPVLLKRHNAGQRDGSYGLNVSAALSPGSDKPCLFFCVPPSSFPQLRR